MAKLFEPQIGSNRGGEVNVTGKISRVLGTLYHFKTQTRQAQWGQKLQFKIYFLHTNLSKCDSGHNLFCPLISLSGYFKRHFCFYCRWHLRLVGLLNMYVQSSNLIEVKCFLHTIDNKKINPLKGSRDSAKYRKYVKKLNSHTIAIKGCSR